MKTIIIGLLLAVSAYAQTYSTRPAKEDVPVVRRFHLAMYLFDPATTPEQRVFLLKAIRNPTKDMIGEAETLFNATDFVNIFVKIGTRDISTYKTVSGMTVLADKKRFVTGLPNAEKWHLWRDHFAYILATKDLTDVQIEFLERLSAEMTGTPDLAKIKLLGAESTHLFNREVGTALFATIGNYTSLGALCRKTVDTKGPTTAADSSDCICAIDHYNWSCNDTCGGGGSCNVVGGCGVLWLYDCTGHCNNGDMEIQ